MATVHLRNRDSERRTRGRTAGRRPRSRWIGGRGACSRRARRC
ncbi:hypothetical protein GLA29479_3928 [Lysobacter antibioticus]|nr:hypothetical protein GLA29479_3928 [Lysobacter antibioticus]